MMANGPEEGGTTLTVRQLSATLAHELNNVLVSLRGFVQLGSAMAAANPRLQVIFAEGDLSAARIAALASDLEVLAAAPSPPRQVVLGDVLMAPPPGSCADLRHPVPPVHWESDARTAVLVDPLRFIPALGVLRRLAGEAATPLRFRVRVTDSPAAPCLGCGQVPAGPSAWFLQEFPPGRLRTLTSMATRPHLGIDRLRLGVLDQAIHPAGGHLVTTSHPDSLALVLPIT